MSKRIATALVAGAAILVGCAASGEESEPASAESVGVSQSALTVSLNKIVPINGFQAADIPAPFANDCSGSYPKDGGGTLSYPKGGPMMTGVRRFAQALNTYLLGGPAPPTSGTSEYKQVRNGVWNDTSESPAQNRLCHLRNAIQKGHVKADTVAQTNICGYQRLVTRLTPNGTYTYNGSKTEIINSAAHGSGCGPVDFSGSGFTLRGLPMLLGGIFYVVMDAANVKIDMFDPVAFPTYFNVSNDWGNGALFIDPEIAVLDASLGSSAGATAAAHWVDTGGATTAYKFGSAPSACGSANGGDPCSTGAASASATLTKKVLKVGTSCRCL